MADSEQNRNNCDDVKYLGKADKPIKSNIDDLFGLTDYAAALAEFIKDCNTPMTIAIQGSWGTGKTSLIYMIKEKLEEKPESDLNQDKQNEQKKIKTLVLNTWQYSQFDLGDQLPITFLNDLIIKLDIKEESLLKNVTNKLKRIGRFSIKTTKAVILTIIDKAAGGRASNSVESGLNACQTIQNDDENEYNLVDEIVSLKKDLKACINSLIKKDETAKDQEGQSTLQKAATTVKDKVVEIGNAVMKTASDKISCFSDNKSSEEDNLKEQNLEEQNAYDRIVVFIDDLDRLSPGKAVELLEVIKVFLDCDNCIFVLAIDYSVVTSGIKQKYNDIDDNKGKQFFDKIIQLPFKMPVSQYEIGNYVDNVFGNIIDGPKQDLGDIQNTIEKTIGKNPRSIKRLYNSFALTLNVAKRKNKKMYDSIKYGEARFNFFFCLHCLQLSHEAIYNYILDTIKKKGDYKNYSKTEGKIEETIGTFETKTGLNNNDNNKFFELFAEQMDELVTQLHSEGFDEKTIDTEIRTLISLTSITSSSRDESFPDNKPPDKWIFNGNEYKPGKQKDGKNTGQLGHDIIITLIAEIGVAGADDVNNFIKDLKKFRGNKGDHQENIIYINGETPNDQSLKLHDSDTINDMRIQVVQYWKWTDIHDLMKFIRNTYPEVQLEVKEIREGKEISL